MKIVTFDGGRIGVVSQDRVIDISDLVDFSDEEWPPVGVNRLIKDFERFRPQIEDRCQTAEGQLLADVTLGTPIPWPSKIVAYPVFDQTIEG